MPNTRHSTKDGLSGEKRPSAMQSENSSTVPSLRSMRAYAASIRLTFRILPSIYLNSLSVIFTIVPFLPLNSRPAIPRQLRRQISIGQSPLIRLQLGQSSYL